MSLPQMSVSGAVLIAVIAVVRALAIHRLPKRVFVLLWSVVLLRLLVPFSIPARMSVYSLVPEYMSADTVHRTDGVFVPAGVPQVSGEKSAAEDASEPKARGRNFVFPVRTLVWLAGAAAGAVYFLVCYVRCRRVFGMSLPVRNAFAARWLKEHRRWRVIQVRQSDRIAAPLTYGVFRPVILMPKKTLWEDEEQISCVLLHEYVHICRLDALRKLLAAAVLCIHWFTPMVWVMYVLLNKDIELSCDEAVVQRLDGDGRALYAGTLIAMEEQKSGLLPLYSNFSRNAMEERIQEIMRAKKITVGITIASVALIAVIAGLFATSARADAAGDVTASAPGKSDGADEGAAAGSATAFAPGKLDGADEGAAAGSATAPAPGKSDGAVEGAGAASGVGEDAASGKAEAPDVGGGDTSAVSAERLVYVEGFDGVTLTFDEVEWVVVPGTRAMELGISPDDAPSGFQVYNEQAFREELPLDADCVCTVLNWTGNYSSMQVTPKELQEIFAEREGIRIPYQITVSQGKIVAISEHYVP